MAHNQLVNNIARARTSANQTRLRLERVTAQARREKEQQEARERKAQREQAAREHQLDLDVVTAMRGISAIASLCKGEQMQGLLEARSAIGEPTILYKAYRDGGSAWEALMNGERDDGGYVWGFRTPRDQEISVKVALHRNEIVLEIDIEFCSFMTSGETISSNEISSWECKVALSTDKKLRKEIALQLRALVLSEMGSPWSEWEIDPERMESATTALLKEIKNADAHVAADDAQTIEKEYEWSANIVLFRFLMDCSRPTQLQQYLDAALSSIT